MKLTSFSKKLRAMYISNDINFEYTFDDYTWAKEIFIELSSRAGISSDQIGFFGNVGFPGISDIDGIVIGTVQQIKKLRLNFENQKRTSTRFSYLFWHEPIYVLDSLIDVAPKLHTLQGLHSIATNKELFDTKLIDTERHILNIVWFISLLQVVASQKRKLVNKQLLSLRQLALVYNNVLHSVQEFAHPDAPQAPELVQSKEFRSFLKVTADSMQDKYVIEKYFALFDYALVIFDSFCKQQSILKGKPSNQLLISKTTLLKKGSNTTVEIKKYINSICLNNFAYQICYDYYLRETDLNGFKPFLDSNKLCMNHYNANRIKYPFIQPYLQTTDPTNKKILFLINKFVLPYI